MKKIILAILLSLTVASAAQAKHLSIEGGYNFSFISPIGNDNAMFHGFYVDASRLIPLIGDYFGIAPGLQYSYGVDKLGTDSNWKEQYVNIPIKVEAGFFPGGKKTRMFVNVGLTPSWCVSSVITSGGESHDVFSTDLMSQISETINFITNPNNSDAQYKRFDLGLGVKVGADFFKHLRVALSYDYGLLDRGGKTHRGQVRLGVGIRF